MAQALCLGCLRAHSGVGVGGPCQADPCYDHKRGLIAPRVASYNESPSVLPSVPHQQQNWVVARTPPGPTAPMSHPELFLQPQPYMRAHSQLCSPRYL